MVPDHSQAGEQNKYNTTNLRLRNEAMGNTWVSSQAGREEGRCHAQVGGASSAVEECLSRAPAPPP